MKPYYEHGGITIYHGDCRAILPNISADILLTDPPYLGLKGGMTYKSLAGVAPGSYAVSVGDLWCASLDWVSAACASVSLGGFVFSSFKSVAETRLSLPNNCEPVGLLVWWKPNSAPAVRNVPRYTTEYIWAFKKESLPSLNWRAIKDCVIKAPMLQAGCMATERFTDESGRSIHPAQKPVSVIKRLLLVGGDSVLDPFAGTGTTLLAAKQLGRAAIGIEIEERYCEIAAKRLSQEVFSFEACAVSGPSKPALA